MTSSNFLIRLVTSIAFFIAFILIVNAQYCSKTIIGHGVWISRFALNEIDNTSSHSTYSNFTSTTTNLLRGETYNAIIETNDATAWGSLYIDWNQDSDFKDSGEKYTFRGTSTIPITVPLTATLGTSRLRAIVSWGTFGNLTNNSCGNHSGSHDLGEPEDYGIIIGDPTLPITLSYFKAQLQNDKIHFDWETLNEINNSFFTIEQSSNGLDWIELAKVNGQGNSSKPTSYRYIDNYPVSSRTLYFRLKQTDFDGQFSYSEILLVQNPNNKILIYPTPANKYINIEGVPNQDFKLFNSAGVNVTSSVQNTIENGVLIIKTSRLQNGLYFLEIGKQTFRTIVRND